MIPVVEKMLYISLIAFAFMAVQTPKLRRAVVFLAVFSAASAFVYLILGAPDAALAEAVIGSTLATVIYLAALQKYKVFTIYYTNERRLSYGRTNMLRRRNAVLQGMESYCTGKELDAHVVYTTESIAEITTKHGWDLIVRRKDRKFRVYGMEQNYHVEEMEKFIKEKRKDLADMGYDIEFIIE